MTQSFLAKGDWVMRGTGCDHSKAALRAAAAVQNRLERHVIAH